MAPKARRGFNCSNNLCHSIEEQRGSPRRGGKPGQWHCGPKDVVSKQTCFLQDLRSYFGGGSAPKVTPKAESAAKPAATGEAAGGARSCMLESIMFLAGVRVVCADFSIVQVPLSSARPRPQCVPPSSCVRGAIVC